MAVDQPRHQHPALAVEPVIGAGRALVAALEYLLDATVVVDQQAGKALDRAIGGEGQPIDIIDQHVGMGGGMDGDEKGNSRKRQPHLLPRLGKRLISALVSCRPPPSAWTSA